MLRLLAQLVAERVPVDLGPLYAAAPAQMLTSREHTPRQEPVRVALGGKPFHPPRPTRREQPAPAASVPEPSVIRTVTPPSPPAPSAAPGRAIQRKPAQAAVLPLDDSLEPVIREFTAAQEARLKAHEAYLRTTDSLNRAIADAISLQISLQEQLATAGALTEDGDAAAVPPLTPSPQQPKAVFDRQMCLEFARGLVGRMLGPAFAEADTFPTRVRLPDEPLMLVDRIVALEGEAQSMTSGRVVTEHDIHPGAWYLDGGRIPTCIAVEAGQADLFLSGYLGIDFITRGLAVYRLLDAVVTFHRELPGPGETIHYDIPIERFFRQGDTYLFRFRFEATVNGAPLLTMRDGCAGFFSAAELAAGKGIVRPNLDLRPRTGIRPADWQELVPMIPEAYNAGQLDRLRAGDLAGCFGHFFAGLNLTKPLTIPGGRMRLVHRVMELDPRGGRYGLGFIRAEADISPGRLVPHLPLRRRPGHARHPHVRVLPAHPAHLPPPHGMGGRGGRRGLGTGAGGGEPAPLPRPGAGNDESRRLRGDASANSATGPSRMPSSTPSCTPTAGRSSRSPTCRCA